MLELKSREGLKIAMRHLTHSIDFSKKQLQDAYDCCDELINSKVIEKVDDEGTFKKSIEKLKAVILDSILECELISNEVLVLSEDDIMSEQEIKAKLTMMNARMNELFDPYKECIRNINIEAAKIEAKRKTNAVKEAIEELEKVQVLVYTGPRLLTNFGEFIQLSRTKKNEKVAELTGGNATFATIGATIRSQEVEDASKINYMQPLFGDNLMNQFIGHYGEELNDYLSISKEAFANSQHIENFLERYYSTAVEVEKPIIHGEYSKKFIHNDDYRALIEGIGPKIYIEVVKKKNQILNALVEKLEEGL